MRSGSTPEACRIWREASARPADSGQSDGVEARPEPATAENVLHAWERAGELIGRAFSPFFTVKLSNTDDDLEAAASADTGAGSDRAHQLIAAFGGAVAGIVLLYIAASLRILDAPTLARAAGGIFVASYVASLIYAFAGLKLKS